MSVAKSFHLQISELVKLAGPTALQLQFCLCQLGTCHEESGHGCKIEERYPKMATLVVKMMIKNGILGVRFFRRHRLVHFIGVLQGYWETGILLQGTYRTFKDYILDPGLNVARPSGSMDWRASESCGFVNCLANSPRPRFVQTAGCWMSDGCGMWAGASVSKNFM